jgi:Domain of unknown function (DUF4349)
MAAVFAALILIGACTSGDDDDSAGGAAATEVPATAPAATDAVATEGTIAETGAPADEQGAGRSSLLQLAGPSIAIEARATVRADDVRAAVDGLTGLVARRGGRVASADIDYAPADEGGAEESRATLVLAVPPEELAAVVDALEDLGTLVSFDQLAEDVTERLIDLDTRIANTRASVARVRALLEAATDIQGIVRLEAELTDREIELETLLASQRQLEDRVAMSTLTVEIVAAPSAAFGVVAREFEPPRPGVAEAVADGWGAFVNAAYAVVLVLATVVPFLVLAAVLAIAVLWVRRMVAA